MNYFKLINEINSHFLKNSVVKYACWQILAVPNTMHSGLHALKEILTKEL